MNIESNLIQLGLNEKEAKTYLAALELGSSSISDIAHKTGLNRVTTYTVIDSLKEKGLISTITKVKKKFYIAAEPDALERLVKSKEKIVEQLMPHLMGLSNLTKKKPNILFYEGEQGMVSLYQKTLEAKGDLLTFGDESHFYELVLEKYFPDYRVQRKEKAIKAKMIIPDTEQGRITQETDRVGFRETKLIPPEKYKFSVYFLLYNNSTIIISPNDLTGLYIESKDITETLKSFHELLWGYLE